MKEILLFVSLGFLVPTAFSDDSISINKHGKNVVINSEDQEEVEIKEEDDAPAKIESNEDGSVNIQQGNQLIRKDADGNTVITDGKDSIVLHGMPSKSQAAPKSGSNNIVIDDDAQDKHVKFTEHGIQIDKGGKHVHLGD